MAIYFDLEFYVPEDAQNSDHKMKTNPTDREHRFLGGVFYQADLPARPDRSKFQELWLWNMPGFPNDVDQAEHKLLDIINKIFAGELESKGTVKTVGIGTARFDLPALYTRSEMYEIATRSKLYRRFLLGFPIDLSTTGVGFVDQSPYGLEPVPANTLYQQFGIEAEKASGSSVWNMYEYEQYDQIEHRTAQEVINIVRLYAMIASEMK